MISPSNVAINYEGLPQSLRGGMRRYIDDRVEPGAFLVAVLRNDLSEACARADDSNRHRLFEIVRWIYNEAPGLCWGSPAAVEAWLEERAER
jgi:hypothetical protein